MVYTLLNNILYFKNGEIHSGFIYFNNEKIIDVGTDPSPEYELAELIIDYEHSALAIHGFSIAIDIFKYVFRNNYSEEYLDTFSNNELEKIVNNTLYELYMNGVTLPVIYGYRIDIVNKVVRENNLKAVLIHSGELREHDKSHYIITENNKLLYKNNEIGYLNKVLCSPGFITNECIFVDTTNYLSQNVSIILYELIERNNFEIEQALRVLKKPFISLGIDNGQLDTNSKPDVSIHDLRNSLKTIPHRLIKYVLLKGYPPDQVFVNGEMYFDHGESLVLLQQRVNNIVLK